MACKEPTGLGRNHRIGDGGISVSITEPCGDFQPPRVTMWQRSLQLLVMALAATAVVGCVVAYQPVSSQEAPDSVALNRNASGHSHYSNTTAHTMSALNSFQDMLDLYACILSLCSLVALVNYHRIKFPLPISLNLCGLVLSVILVFVDVLFTGSPIRT